MAQVGNYERVRVSVTGSGESLIQPLLDNQLERQHQALGAKPPPLSTDLSLADAVDLVKVWDDAREPLPTLALTLALTLA